MDERDAALIRIFLRWWPQSDVARYDMPRDGDAELVQRFISSEQYRFLRLMEDTSNARCVSAQR